MTSAEILETMGVRQDERVRMALDRGGLPTEAEAEALHNTLGDVYGTIETLAYRTEWLADADVESLPFTVSLEHLGVLATILTDLMNHLDRAEEEATRIRKAISGLAAIRSDQLIRRKHDDG